MPSLVHALRMQAAMRVEPRTAKLRKWPRPRWPHQERLKYYKELLAIVATLERVVERELLPKLPAILDAHAVARPEPEPVRHDATGNVVDDAFAAMGGEVAAAIPERHIEMLAQSNALRVSAFNGKELQKQIQHVAKLNLFDDSPALAAHLDVFVADNVALIKGLVGKHVEDMHGIVLRGARQGLHHSVVAEQIRERFEMPRKRAALIATDQIGKLNGELNSLRQQNIGVRRYRWSSSQDERVRPRHRVLNDSIQTWTAPPIVDERTGDRGHPGQPIRCRCQPIPIIDDVLVDAGLMDPADVDLGQSKEARAAQRGPFVPPPPRVVHEPPAPKQPKLPKVPKTFPKPPPANVPAPPSKRLGEVGEKVFGRKLTDAELDDLTGLRAELPPGHRLEVSVRENAAHGRVTIGAAIFDAAKNNVGEFLRHYTHVGGQTEVYHASFHLYEAYQKGGLGKGLFNAQIDAYVKHGIAKVSLDAAEVGKYVWTKAGFEWTDAAQVRRVFAKLGEHLKSKVGAKAAQKLLARTHTPEDIAQLVIGEERVGKEFLLELDKYDDKSAIVEMAQTPAKIKRL